MDLMAINIYIQIGINQNEFHEIFHHSPKQNWNNSIFAYLPNQFNHDSYKAEKLVLIRLMISPSVRLIPLCQLIFIVDQILFFMCGTANRPIML